jgi:hypothetical protein
MRILITWHLSPSTARSARFRLHPAAEGKAAKTISTYTEALAWLVAVHVVSRTRHADWDGVPRQGLH